MRATIITILAIILFYIIVIGTINIAKRNKERDKMVDKIAEENTEDPITAKASGTKPTNVNKVLSDLTELTIATQRVKANQ